MKIVVTGALGHIGSLLIRRCGLSFPDCELVMLDNLSTQRYCSLFNLPGNARYRFVEGDVLTADLKTLFEGAAAVVHLAAVTDAESSFDIKANVHKVNFEGTRLVADVCREKGVPMILVSTTSVYGSQEKTVDENCSLEGLKPQSPYAESKLRAEQYVLALAKDGLRSVVFRFGTIYGISIGMRFHTAVNKFCWQAAIGLPITVWRTAMDQYRPYLDLQDAVEAVMFVIRKNLFDSRVYNVVTDNETVSRITGEIARHVPDLSITLVDTKIMNQLSYHVSNVRFREAGFLFSGSLERGIADTIALLRNTSPALVAQLGG
ncbi:MAG: SDR family oxidoreductase [Syntrophales bacterium]